jgi:hypothetical protein
LFAKEIKSDHISFESNDSAAIVINNGDFYWKREKKANKEEASKSAKANENQSQ